MKLGLNNEGQVLQTGPNKNAILFRWILPVFQQHVRGCTCISQSKEMNKSMSFLLACSFSQAKQVYFCVQGTRERRRRSSRGSPKMLSSFKRLANIEKKNERRRKLTTTTVSVPRENPKILWCFSFGLQMQSGRK